ncbi:hypothetical protein EOD39_7084 [Acipenser ruthenus]|uniref:Structural maintenance of chromosomes protein n=1 Tax=Acipenser ruthenus TaxID=7906 RepID=A0A444U880_ACIRT|nr:hypothetical protein EOD39_7084 [Acipenser ruthenus]
MSPQMRRKYPIKKSTQMGKKQDEVKRFSCIIGPNGSGKSNVIDSMLFVFGYRAQKIRSKKLSVLIHSSDEHSDVQSCTVEVHFQKIIDKEGDDYEVIPSSKFYVSRTAYKDNSSVYNINGKKATFKDVGALLRSHGIDLDHNRFLILQEGDDYEVIPSSKFYVSRTAYKDNSSVYNINGKKATFKDVGALLRSHGIDLDHNRFLILQRNHAILPALKVMVALRFCSCGAFQKVTGDTVNISQPSVSRIITWVSSSLVGRLTDVIKFPTMECVAAVQEDFYEIASFPGVIGAVDETLIRIQAPYDHEEHHDLQRRVTGMEAQKQTILDDTKDVNEKSRNLSEQLKVKNKALKDVEKKLGKITKFIEERKEKFTQLDLQDVEVREKLKHSKSKVKKLQKQLQKDKEKAEELNNVPANSEKTISEATAKKEEQEKQKAVEEEKLKKVMESLKLETQGLQQEKEVKEKELMELSKAVNATRSTMDVAQSEIDIYLSCHNTALTQLNNAKEALQTTTETLKERKTAIKELETKIPKSDGEIREVVRGLRQKVEEAKSSLSSNRSRGKVLDALMQQKKSGKIPGILGRLGDLGAIDEKYDVAISSSCGSLDNILVDTIDTAQECVNFLKKQNVGVATFIGLDKMKVWENKMAKIQTPENIPRLFDMVKVQDEAILPAFYFALRNTLVADHLEQATRLAFQKDKRWRVVTLQGQIIEQSGTMTGGGGRVMKGRMGSSLAQEVSQEELDAMESKLKKDVVLAQTYQEGKGKLEEKVHTMRQTIREMKNTLEKYIASIKSLSEQEVHLKVQMKELQANVVAAAPDKIKQKQLEKTLETFKKEYESAAGKAGKVEAEVKRLHNLIIDINNHKLKAQQDKLDKINKEIDDCASAITKAQVAIKTAGRNLKKSEDTVTRTEQEIVENDKAVEDLTGELKKLEEEATVVMKECKEAEARFWMQSAFVAGETLQINEQNKETLPEVQEEHRAVLLEIKAIQEEDHALQKESLNIRLKIEQIESHIAEHQSKIKHWQKEISRISLHAIDDKTAEELQTLTQEDLEATKDPGLLNNQIALLEAKCLEIKPNLGAIAEYKKKEEMYLQRVAELDEITNERDNFRRAYEDLRKQRLNEFMAGFNVITNKLKENYQMLTLGGDAELELVDSLDPFSEGIMFSVRPPKKSWKKIFNLSGGEKTLSSLALVFALHHFKPTPLYFMDEIDAALDFKNVSIVAFYIYEQTKNAQFIIISLRNNMFEIADRLIGIYKTHNTTKSVGINPKIIASKELTELPSE